MIANRRLRPLLLLLLLPAAACAPEQADPFLLPGTWRATGANDANLRAMVADPSHLQTGAEARSARGEAAARPVLQLLEGRRPGMPSPSSPSPSPAAGGGNDPAAAALGNALGGLAPNAGG